MVGGDESDTDEENKMAMKEKAVATRRNISIKRRERNARKADRNNNANNNNDAKSDAVSRQESVKSVYDNVPLEEETQCTNTVINSVSNMQCIVTSSLTTATTSVSMTTTLWSPTLSPQNIHAVTSTSDTPRKQYKEKLQEMREKRLSSQRVLGKDASRIPSGKVQDLIKKIKNIEIELGPNLPLSPTGCVTSPKDKFEFEIPTKSAETSQKNNCRLINSTMCDPISSSSINTVSTVNSTKQSSDTLDQNNVSQTVQSNLDNRTSIVTTLSLPLTLTSESSNENSDEEESVVKKVNRLSRSDSIKESQNNEKNTEGLKKPREIFLTRSVSMENGSKNRRSRNLMLEAKLSNETDKAVDSFLNAQVPLELPNDKQSNTTLEDAKLFLFEKLCSVKPDYNTTDHMSEEVDHIWSDQEKSIHPMRLEPPIIATGEKNSTGNTQESRSPVKPASNSPQTANDILSEKNTNEASDLTSNVPSVMTTSTKAESNRLNVPKIMPTRNDSMKSTKSEMLHQKLMFTKRGRSTKSTIKDVAVPRDFNATPNANVHKLAEKFNRNTTALEANHLLRNIPRRSRSVGHTIGRRKANARYSIQVGICASKFMTLVIVI